MMMARQRSHEEWLNSIMTAEDANINRPRSQEDSPHYSFLIEAEEWNINAISSGSRADQSCHEEAPARIHKVHQMLRETKEFETYYVPRVVSIGPYHYHNQKLHPMNKFKLITARELVSNDRQRLEDLYQELFKEIEQVKDCYEENDFSNEEFTWMMLLDGCFILYFIQHYHLLGYRREMAQLQAYHISFVEGDFLLLENQLPFLVLELIMKNIKSPMDNLSSKRLLMIKVKCFIEHINIVVRPIKRMMDVLDNIENLPPGPAHLLDLLHKTMVGSKSSRHEECIHSREECNSYTVRNVKELKAVGIKVKLSKTSCLPDIQYTSRCLSGRLRLPPIKVDDLTKAKLMNLIAYEMYCPGASNDKWVTSYVSFLDSLIDHADDVKALRSAKILRNRLGSDDEVAKLFNEIGKGLVPHPCAYSKVKHHIQGHYDNKGLNYMAQLNHQHFKNPWTIIALIAGVLLLFLTGVQTYFQVWSPPNECDLLCKYIKTNHHI